MSPFIRDERLRAVVDEWLEGRRGPALDWVIEQETPAQSAHLALVIVRELEQRLCFDALDTMMRELHDVVDFERRDVPVTRGFPRCGDTSIPPM